MERVLVAAVVVAALVSGCARPTDPSADGPSASATAPSASVTPTRTTAEVPPLHPSVDGYPAAHIGLRDPDGRLVEGVAVRVAATAAHRAHGLMEVRRLPEGSGMLFVFPDVRDGGFWMKNTLVPLSIAFADADGAVLAILEMVPCTTPQCEVYTPGVEYTYAFEVPAGWFDEVGLSIGWQLDVPAGISATE